MTIADTGETAESRIRRAAASGELVDLHPRLDDHFIARVSPGRRAGPDVPAALIIELLATTQPSPATPHPAVRLCGATITGSLNLESTSLACPLLLQLCQFTEPVILDDATAPKLSFRSCHVPGFSARRLSTSGSVTLDERFTSTAGVNLTGARI